MTRLAPIFVLLTGLALAACPKSGDGSTPPEEGPTTLADDGQPAGQDGEPAADDSEPSPDVALPPGGCFSEADCGGNPCEGLGCGADEPGQCTEPGRMCTRDSVPYCGCDGETFRGSGTCPGRRYAHEGAC